MAKTARYHDAIESFKDLDSAFTHFIEGFGVDPLNIDIHIVIPARVTQRFRDGQVGIMEFDVFPDNADGQFRAGTFDLFYQLAPLLHVGLPVRQTKLLHHVLAQTCLFQDQGHFIDRLGGQHGDDGPGLDITEQGDFFAQFVGHGIVGAAEDDIRLDADAQEFFDTVLSGFCFQFFCCPNIGEKGYVQVEHVSAAYVFAHLADSLQIWLALDITNGAANLHDHHVGIGAAGNSVHALFDFVRDVRDDLNGATKVLTTALFADDGGVDLARGHVVGLIGWLICEAFVVAQVEVGLRAVIGHKNFAMLVRRHRTGININIGVQFHDRDGDPTVF